MDAAAGLAWPWLDRATTRVHRRGERLVRAGAALDDWVALASGAVRVDAVTTTGHRLAVAALWAGDVIGRCSPLGSSVALYDAVALTDATTLVIRGTELAREACDRADDARLERFHIASEARLARQISMRLAGNGLQNLVRVLATLARALTHGSGERLAVDRIELPVSQSLLGEMSGISRRQAWIYLGRLAEAGWLQTARAAIVLVGASAWLRLLPTLESQGLGCVETIDRSVDLLGSLALSRTAA